MLSDKDWIKKLDDETLKYLMNRQDILDEMPDDLEKDLSLLPSRYQREKDQILKKERIKRNRLVLRYSLSFAVILIAVFFSFLFIYLNYYGKTNSCVVSQVTGDAFLIKNNKKEKIYKGKKITEKTNLHTGEDSSLNILIGTKSYISIEEKSSLEIIRLFKSKKAEHTSLFLNKGESVFNVGKLQEDSTFEVKTDSLIINVIGTKFKIKIDEKKNTIVEVFEGNVYIKPNFDIPLNKIRKIDKSFYHEIIKLLDKQKAVKKGLQIKISYNILKDNEKKINIIIDNLLIDLLNYKDDKNKFNELKKDAVNKINVLLTDKKLFIQQYPGNKNNTEKSDKDNDEDLIIKKLPFNPGLNLNEKNTAVTSGYSIYITSDSHKALMAVNPVTGKLQWKYVNSKISNLTSPAVFYKNKIFLATNNQIYILNKDGKEEKIIEINGGPVYWASPLITKNKLFIPGNDIIYEFNDMILNKIENIHNNTGQLYITTNNKNDLICSNLNTRKIAGYDYISSQTGWISNPITDRSFMAPVYYGNNIYIADSRNSIYKYIYKSDNKNPSILNLGTGIISNIITRKNYLYFVANDGFFYRLNIDNFDKANKLIKIDNNPDSNKYLTKKLLISDNYIYFSSDTGKAFCLDLSDNKTQMISFNDNFNPLIASPVKIKDSIFFIDNKSGIYKLTRKK